VVRFVLLEQAAPAEVEAVAHELAATQGARVVLGDAGGRDGAVVCVRRVRSEADAAQAVLAAVAGAALVIDAAAPRDVIDQLSDDLRRLGVVDHRIGPAPRPVLAEEERALLAQLLAGANLGEAARALHLSRRTADRRLAAARRALGATSTAEALRRAVEAGVRPAG
jgi:DNA-binding NarL/FixJ family response regulator